MDVPFVPLSIMAHKMKLKMAYPKKKYTVYFIHLGHPLRTAFQKSLCLKSLESLVATITVGSHTMNNPINRYLENTPRGEGKPIRADICSEMDKIRPHAAAYIRGVKTTVILFPTDNDKDMGLIYHSDLLLKKQILNTLPLFFPI
jgi:hypothetical protein